MQVFSIDEVMKCPAKAQAYIDHATPQELESFMSVCLEAQAVSALKIEDALACTLP